MSRHSPLRGSRGEQDSQGNACINPSPLGTHASGSRQVHQTARSATTNAPASSGFSMRTTPWPEALLG
ncbi:MAG: hypothetical protein ACLT8E_01110 [Akkermansia sp.]